MDDAKQQLVDKLKTANNILVTVSRNPTVDQLASCLGLALMLNKQGKHMAAVFSGEVPSTLEFLQPEETLEKNTDSLRDFIIALDKSKADKLRYKVEDNVVRIFITPYKTSISEADLDFSQGDFNVDLVVALGVGRQEDLDEAIVAHGRILHDATVASINIVSDGELGTINWNDPQASSLCELVTNLVLAIDSTLLDTQIATALLTGIVSATERFSNDKTSSQTMSASATLMTAGANQQLVASKLQEPVQAPAEAESETQEEADIQQTDKPADDGTIEIDHENDESDEGDETPVMELPTPDDSDSPEEPAPVFDANPEPADDSSYSQPNGNLSSGSRLMTGPPSLGGTLTANSQPEVLDSTSDPMSMPAAEPPQLLERKPEPAPTTDMSPPPADWTPPEPAATPAPPLPVPVPEPVDSETTAGPSLSELEEEVKSSEATGLDTARSEVDQALSTAEATIPPKPIEALNAQTMVDNLNVEPAAPPEHQELGPTLPQILTQDNPTPPPVPVTPDPQVSDPSAPPPVPPPIPFQFGSPNPPQQ